MVRVSLSKLNDFTGSLFLAIGMNAENVKIITDVLMRATLHGVGHHDIYYLPDRFKMYMGQTKNLWGDIGKKININPNITRINSFFALESYDGDYGPGEICSSFIMARACQLADTHGISLCTIQNSNCFLCAAPYVEKAAEKGYLAIIYTRTHPAMNAPGTSLKVITTSPMGFAAGTDNGFPIMLDTCLAYISYGSLWEKAKLGEKVPSHWGLDANGLATDDPAAIRNGGVTNPVGGHKGFGLAMLTEMLTGVLSGGQVTDEKESPSSRGYGIHSQTAIVIKPSGLLPPEQFEARNSDMMKRLKAKVPDIHIPGEMSAVRKKTLESQGWIELTAELVMNLNALAKELRVEKLTA